MRVRKPRWQREFWRELDKQARKPFKWGERDCIMFGSLMADVIIVEPFYVEAAKRAFTWSTGLQAASILRDQNMQEAIESVLGEPQPWPQLEMGDLVLCHYEDPDLIFNTCLGIHDGTNPICVGDRILVARDWSDAICGWKV